MKLTSLDLLESGVMTIASVALSLAVAMSIVLLVKKLVFTSGYNYPPGPAGWPGIGNFLLLAAKRPHQTLHDLAQIHGQIFSVKLGSIPVVILSSADMAKEVLKTQDAVFASRVSPSVLAELFFYNNDIIMGPLTDHWRLLRKICSSEFSGTKRVAQSKVIRREETMRTINGLLGRSQGEKLQDMYLAVSEVNFHHISRLLFGPGYYEGSSFTASDAETFPRLLRSVASRRTNVPGEIFPSLRWLDIGGAEAYLKSTHKQIDDFLRRIMENRRNQRAKNPDGDSSDFLSVLLSMQESEDEPTINDVDIKAMLLDMLAGGVETTVSTVLFALAETIKNPDIMHKLVSELDAVVGKQRLLDESDIPDLKYLRAIVNESLRFHPVLPMLVPHVPTKDTKVAGYDIPKNTQVFINIHSIQRDPALYEDPLRFDPSRFLESPIDTKGQNFGLLPFGSGRRMCLGMNIGKQMVEYTLAQFVHCLDFHLPPGMKPEDVDVTEKVGLTSSLDTPLRLVVTHRLPKELYSTKLLHQRP